MTLLHAKVAINATTPTVVTPVGTETGMNLSLQIQNLGMKAVYVGNASLTASSYGAVISSGATLSIDNLSRKDDVYVLSADGDSHVAVLTIGR